MPTRLRKVRKRRGSRTHGWGQVGQHRKTGAKGGRGMAGGHKHKWTKLLKTDYFGKNGFVPVTRNEVREANLITVSQLAEKTGDSVVNLAEAGYDKLLASGRIFKPLTVVVSRWTKRAEEKIRSVGGRIVKPGELVTA
ncbi:MAG: uL15 family ribosomal protein [Candidatus Caldarchaeum sp.]|nr:uL15 family ribosomal protein [Candidatus Caldarchaeum sp.]